MNNTIYTQTDIKTTIIIKDQLIEIEYHSENTVGDESWPSNKGVSIQINGILVYREEKDSLEDYFAAVNRHVLTTS